VPVQVEKPGDTILLFGTGFGATTPLSPIGQLISAAPMASLTTVQIGGVVENTLLPVLSALDCISSIYDPEHSERHIPSGDNPVSISTSGSQSHANIFLTIEE